MQRWRGREGQSGQTFLVAVMALLLLGASVLSGLRYIGPKVTLHYQQQTPKIQKEVIQKALYAFVAKNYRLPYPADGSYAFGAACDGVETSPGSGCSLTAANHGVVPWKTLGLQYTDVLDGYGDRIGYSASASQLTGTPYQNSVPQGNAIAVTLCSAPGSCAAATDYAYALISFGADRAGAWNQDGKQIAAPAQGAAEFPNTQAAAFASGGTGFVVYPYCGQPQCTSAQNTAKMFDDALVYETSTQICTDMNFTQTGDRRIVCNQPHCSHCPPLATANTDTVAAAANPNYSINNTYSCSSGANYCPGSTNAGSLANTASFVGSSVATSAGQWAPGGASATLVGNLGAATVHDSVFNSGISIGNNNGQANGSGDWVGANHDGSCSQCFGNSYTQNYLVPGQTLSYAFTNSYLSFAFADYLVDGGMQVQVDGYAANVYSFTGTLANGTATISNVSSTAGLAVGQYVIGTNSSNLGVATGATIAAISGSTVTMSANATAGGSMTLYAMDNAFLVTGTISSGSQSITGVSPNPTTTGIRAGQYVFGAGIPAGTTVTSVNGTTLTISQSAVVSASVSVPLVVTPWNYVGTMILSNGAATNINAASPITGKLTAGSATVTSVSSVSGLAAGQPIAGAGIAPGATIAAVDPGSCTAPCLTLSANATISTLAPTETLNITTPTIAAVGPLYVEEGNVVTSPVTGTVTNGSATVTNVSSTQGLSKGQPITGTGILAGTTILTTPAAGATTLTLSKSAALSPSPATGFLFPAARTPLTDITGTVTSGSSSIAGVTTTTGLAANDRVSGMGIPQGTQIASTYAGGSTLPVTQAATAAVEPAQPEAVYFDIPITAITGNITNKSSTITGLSSTNGLAVGEFVSSPGLQPQTTITAISGSSLTISQAATATVTTAPLIAGYAPPLSAATITGTIAASALNQISAVPLPSSSSAVPVAGVPEVGQELAGPGVPVGTVVEQVDGSAGSTATVTLTQSATTSEPSGTAFYATYPACPGPAATLGTSSPQPAGLYASPPATAQTQGPDAPYPQHPSATTAAGLLSQIWPQPATKNTGLPSASSSPNGLTGNYADQRDNQFTNRQFMDANGNAMPFNVLVFQVLPYTYNLPSTAYARSTACTGATTGTGDTCPYGNGSTYAYGMLFEGVKGCYSDAYSADCVFVPGTDEWSNPPVTVTQDCGQHPS